MNIERFVYMFKNASESVYDTALSWHVLCSAENRGKLSYNVWMEELFELISVLQTKGTYAWYSRLEEVADVLICIEQIKRIAGYKSEPDQSVIEEEDIIPVLALFGQEISKFSRGMRTIDQLAEYADAIERKLWKYLQNNFKYTIYDVNKAINTKNERFVARYGADALGDFIVTKMKISEDIDYHFNELKKRLENDEVIY